MRTLLIVMVLAAAAAAEPVKPAPGKAAPAHEISTDVWVPDINLTELTVTGAGVQPWVVSQALTVLEGAVQRCYQQAAAPSRKLAGTLALRVRLDGKGTPANIAASGVPGMTGCMTEAIKAGAFSAPEKGPIELREKVSLRVVAVRGGILGSSTLSQGGAFASLTGSADISSSFDDANVAGGLLGNDADVQRGGLRGGATAPTVSSGQVTAQGDYDKAIIRRYIHRNIQKLQYCYEKQLLAHPGLAGTVLAKFTIGSDGLVKTSTASGLSDTEVAVCVASVIRDIEFPKPKGDVAVSYPFTFHAADDKK